MQVSEAFAGFTPSEAEELRRAMSRKRSQEAMERNHERFLAGAIAHSGADPRTAERVWEMVSGFAGFGFPKAHATAFGLLAYQSTWLRVHYGPEFLCALLNEHGSDFYAPDSLVHEAQRRGIPVLALDVNASAVLCEVQSAGEQLRRAALGSRLHQGRCLRGGARPRGRASSGRAVSGPWGPGRSYEHGPRHARAAGLVGSVRCDRRRSTPGALAAGNRTHGKDRPGGSAAGIAGRVVRDPEPASDRSLATCSPTCHQRRERPRSRDGDFAADAPARPAVDHQRSAGPYAAWLLGDGGGPGDRSTATRGPPCRERCSCCSRTRWGVVNLIVRRRYTRRRALARAERLLLARGRLERHEGVTNVIVRELEPLERFLAAPGAKEDAKVSRLPSAKRPPPVADEDVAERDPAEQVALEEEAGRMAASMRAVAPPVQSFVSGRRR